MAHATRVRKVLAIATLLVMACASSGGLPAPGQVARPFQIGPEDVIEVVVWKNENVSRTVPVRPDGMISLPLVNDVRAAGLTPLELRDVLTAAFRKFMPTPEVFVIVQQVNSPKVLVLGEVMHPGRYVIRGPTTVLDIVAQAGGLTEFASRSAATITRTLDDDVAHYEVATRADELDSTRPLAHIVSGDILVVP